MYKVYQVKYTGPLKELTGKTAIAQDGPFRVQFDGKDDWRVSTEHKLRHPDTGVFLCLNWHAMPEKDFEVIK